MKELICNIHDDIYKKADKAISDVPRFFSYSNMDKEELYEMCSDMESYIDDLKYALENIKELVEFAKERGQAMENRLKDYKDTIEGLGFKREREE